MRVVVVNGRFHQRSRQELAPRKVVSVMTMLQLSSEGKKKSIGDCSDAPCLLPSRRVLGKSYGSTVNALQPAVVATGALPTAPALKRMTPSSFAQKLRTPDWLKVNGEAPTV